MSGKVHPLHGSQQDAVDSGQTVWLSASAGTGKTQVLSARVLRLLLQPDVTPSQILCLTFTKAGAAEMAVRVNEVLANWVRMKPEALAKDLKAIGADFGPETQARARTLFASVLDCPGGGLRIDTIHAFSQWLLTAFPEEAGLAPGTRAMEDRDRDLFAREVLARMLTDAEAQGDEESLQAIADLSLRKGPDAVEAWLMQCARALEAWTGAGAWTPPLRPRVNLLLGLSADADLASLPDMCSDDAFDVRALRQCLAAQRGWSAKTGQDCAAVIEGWLAGDTVQRMAALDELASALFTQKGEPRSLSAMLKLDAGYADAIGRVQACVVALQERRALVELAGWLTPALTVGRKFALAWDEAKAREGFVDFDDQIRRAAELLTRSGMAEWIRYKLDRRFDHILIDEAQDTNEAQWRIIDALTGDFFAGSGQHDGKLRTLFVVGDYKQAIFRFQGTSPENFSAARDRVKASMGRAVENEREVRGKHVARELLDLGLSRSFRTAQPVLDFVDAAIQAIGPERFGLADAPERHVGEERPGIVGLWRAVGAGPDEDEEPPEDEQEWLSRPDRQLADRIAGQIEAWMREGFPLVKGGARRAGPGDVMVLVRKRKELAGLIVARLHARRIPVAGVDRLRLGAPLAVKDLMAALRFAAQPLDDLNLANLLGAPLLGWSQEQLLEHCFRDKGVALWTHLRRSRHPEVADALERLGDLLARADFEPPQALLHWLLVGPWQGRRKLVARLGKEANDPIDELVNAALAYASAHTPSLKGFLQWFDAGEGELKREAGASDGLVRVMTVHGSKGLQAPIVILADAAGNPDASLLRGLSLQERSIDGGPGKLLPLPGLSKAERVGRIREAEAVEAKAEREEHWRLLYVAMTRAEEALFIAGSLGARETQPAPDSWYAQLAPLFTAAPLPDPIWGERREWGVLADLPAAVAPVHPVEERMVLPEWMMRPIGPEPRPPRPLAPSAAGEDNSPDPPFPPGAGVEAARRGVLIHRLLERLPELPPEQRGVSARAWLERNAADLGKEQREEIAESALVVLASPDWEDVFAPGALAEVPLAATVDGQVVTGTVDRLLISPDRITVVDFKTARRAPAGLEEVPGGILRQMGAYAAALREIYPGREVTAALLYTQVPILIPISADVLERNKPSYLGIQQTYPG
ncbi:double-strand break repair helicase AddA [Tsuneonella sp. CC-YZS046]|uniref:double-strand break repair helicase AddA n=1 Tax=Tsuneonella sp. CC-YZS046 TaxID=3042152 RepID=UPI002D76612D|nr:double-strand break repair helicase AddA [Tsuneonella sp. CC-YZS046]WRO67552.1 double-strand break repair helicase AddA [Tsuneonella sp. CC-YZS046]